MTSHPAVPESETPEVDAALDALAPDQRGAVHYNGRTFIDLAHSLERRLALAQTEIKGHMRVVDELRAELQEAHRELGMIPIGWQPKHDYLLGELAKAQARIAELEKAIQRVVETDDFDDLELDDGLWTNSARRFLQAALKDRA